MNFSCHLGIIALTTGINCTRYRSCNYFACCSCNYSQIALKSMWLPIQIMCHSSFHTKKGRVCWATLARGWSIKDDTGN